MAKKKIKSKKKPKIKKELPNLKKEKEKIELPKGLTLMPNEKVLARHENLLASNKRIIHFKKSFVSSATEDFSYNHMKGTQIENKRPLLGIGIVLGLIFLIIGAAGDETFFLIGVICIAVGILYKQTFLSIKGTEGVLLMIPDIKSEEGEKFVSVIRKRLYEK